MKGHRWFAASYDLFMRASEKQLRPVRQFVAGGATGRVLEIGAGTGANLAAYDWALVQSLDACEPDPFMLRRAQSKAASLPSPVRVTLHEAAAEELPFPDGSLDTVVATLVLCTVADVPKSLAEVRRVLKPGGTFRLAEHVRSSGYLGRVQDVLQPVYGRVSAGCHMNRNTEMALRDAGFNLKVERRFRLGVFDAFAGCANPLGG